MPVLELTARKIDSLLAQARESATRVDYFDRAFAGLCLRVGPRGGAWYRMRRVDGKLLRLHLGPYPEVSLAEARKRFDAIGEAQEGGEHPRAHIARERGARASKRKVDENRIARVLGARWIAEHAGATERRNRPLSPTTRADYQRGLQTFLDEFGERDLGTIRRSELVRFLRATRTKSGAEANRAATVIRQLFNYAMDEIELESSPAASLKNPQRPIARTRTLERGEIRILWRACEIAGYPYGHALRFALCTGQRIGEVGAITRRDLDESGQWWMQTRNKARRRIDVYLAPLARAIIGDCPYFGNRGHVFSATGGTGRLRSDCWKNARRRHIDPALAQAAAELGLPPIADHWTPHDLRRTVRTGLTGWCRVTPDDAERVLNHAIGGLRAHYDHADYRPHMQSALERWDAELQAIINPQPQPGTTVVPIKRRTPAR
jgi:integrase